MELKQNTKLIVDTDMGIDDALAFMLFDKIVETEIIGITTCAGNVDLENVNRNVLSVLTLLGKSYPVYSGAGVNIQNEPFVHEYVFHGKNGLSDVLLHSNRKLESINARDFIVESARKYPGNLYILVLGPITNLASALKKNPSIANKFAGVVVMGGNLNVPGNQTKYAEFNVYQDPEAYRYVISKIKDVMFVGLDETGKCTVTEDDIPGLSDFPALMIQNWYDRFGNKFNRQFELYDPLAASVFMGNFMEFENISIDIVTKGDEKGRIIEGKYPIQYAVEVDNSGFKKMFMDAIAKK